MRQLQSLAQHLETRDSGLMDQQPSSSSEASAEEAAPLASDQSTGSREARRESSSQDSSSGADDVNGDASLAEDDEDRLLSYDPTPAHNPYPAPKWFSVKQLRAREVGLLAVGVPWMLLRVKAVSVTGERIC